MSQRDAIYTIGHSTRSLDEFVSLLKAHGITHLADIRTVPRSRRHPHFAGDALARSLAAAGIVYRHFAGLGGLRKPRRDSPNAAWRHEGFRGYADYMGTAEFEAALDELIDLATTGGKSGKAGKGGTHLVIMCAEAVWWRCHRQLVADALVARSFDVGHIVSTAAPTAHTLTSFARVVDGKVTYRGLI
jgi:uncharacterized protein (DUF488 family)